MHSPAASPRRRGEWLRMLGSTRGWLARGSARAVSICPMPKPTFVGRLKVLATLLEPTRRSLYEYVAVEPSAVSRDQAAAAVGVTRAMAAFHLDKLVESGLLRAEYRRLTERSGRGAGRPSKLYRRSRRRFDVTLPRRDHELLANLLAESLDPRGGVRSARDAAHAYGRSLGVRARKRVGNAAASTRLASCVEDVMADIGFEPISRGGPETRARNCPFDPLSRRFPTSVCQTALAVVAGVVDGVEAVGLQVDREPRPDGCCVVLRIADRST
jgi:predicted ArsR family transcriptional regulator